MTKLKTIGDLENFLKNKGVEFKKRISPTIPDQTRIIYKFKDFSGELLLDFEENINIIVEHEREEYSKKMKFYDLERGLSGGYVRLPIPNLFQDEKYAVKGPSLANIMDKKFGLYDNSYMSEQLEGKRDSSLIQFIEGDKPSREIKKGIRDVQRAYFFLKKVEEKIHKLIRKQIKTELGKVFN